MRHFALCFAPDRIEHSLCKLCVLSASVVDFCRESVHHRGTEDIEVHREIKDKFTSQISFLVDSNLI